MLRLETYIDLDDDTINSPNLVEKFGERDLCTISSHVFDGYTADCYSRRRWEERTEAAMDLAMQLQKSKSFPWPGCSSVAFPLVTIATMQFHSRAYANLIQGNNIVKARIIGPDPDGTKRARAERISSHMSYQVTEEDVDWEEQHDRLLINLPTVGCAFIKTYYSSSHRTNISELVLAKDFVIDYYAKSVEQAARKTQRLHMSRNQIHERILRGIYTDVRDEAWYEGPSMPSTYPNNSYRSDIRLGMNPPQPDSNTPFSVLEQHCWLDLDGDGYAEPYIVTIEEQSRCVLRIVTRFNPEDIEYDISKKNIVTIKPIEYFTVYPFLPSPDGGIYGLGFGVLLGPINESVNAIVNQLIDSGTLANTSGGFIGRGVKIHGGQYTFQPFGWNRVDSTGDDLSKNIFPMPVRQPSPVLLQLLSLLIDYSNRVAGATDMMMGENPGQNTPAETARTMTEQGQKIYNSIYKRVWRSMKEEFRKLYELNKMYLGSENYFEGEKFISREDYQFPFQDVVPAANPNLTSEALRNQQATVLRQAAATTPGYDRNEVEKFWLKSMHIEGIEAFYPGPDKAPPMPPDPKMQLEQMKLQTKQAQVQAQSQSALQQLAMKLSSEQDKNRAQIDLIEAQTAQILSGIDQERAGHELEVFRTQVEALKSRNDTIQQYLKLASDHQQQGQQNDNSGSMAGMENEPSNQGGNGLY